MLGRIAPDPDPILYGVAEQQDPLERSCHSCDCKFIAKISNTFSTMLKEPSIVRVADIPLSQIRRPLPRQTDAAKVLLLMESIAAEGLREPIDVLEVDGQYYGFSGCHRFEAHQRLGLATIRCRIRRAPRSVLQMHLA